MIKNKDFNIQIKTILQESIESISRIQEIAPEIEKNY